MRRPPGGGHPGWVDSAGQPGVAQLRVAPELRFLLLPRRRALATIAVPVDGVSSVVHIVQSLGIPRTEVGEYRVRGLPVPADYLPQGGDEIEVRAVARPQYGLPERFLLDVHLGALARRMRLLGLDTAYSNRAGDPELVYTARREGRVLLTRDRGLLGRRALVAGALVRHDDPDEQLADLLDRFAPDLAPWTRCPACNGLLQPVPLSEVVSLLQPGTARTYRDFSRCVDCRQVYWRGAHAARLVARVARAVEQLATVRDRAAESPGESGTLSR